MEEVGKSPKYKKRWTVILLRDQDVPRRVRWKLYVTKMYKFIVNVLNNILLV
jgi:hypothetical protein